MARKHHLPNETDAVETTINSSSRTNRSAQDAVQIFSGRALTQSGMGKNIEMLHKTYKLDAILGGAEEVLADLGVRQALKNMHRSML
ncbi:hypothetical protein BUE80_DR008674 [Diplocarpon rosae]|nr:hypothetical protein BUE80_DR008674 [Diplocarpon rosae]